MEEPGGLGTSLGEALGASEYVNPPGGADLFNPARFKEASIKLTIQRFKSLEYKTRGYKYIPDLSIIDALMWMQPKR